MAVSVMGFPERILAKRGRCTLDIGSTIAQAESPNGIPGSRGESVLAWLPPALLLGCLSVREPVSSSTPFPTVETWKPPAPSLLLLGLFTSDLLSQR